jgi:hypothetical protein
VLVLVRENLNKHDSRKLFFTPAAKISASPVSASPFPTHLIHSPTLLPEPFVRNYLRCHYSLETYDKQDLVAVTLQSVFSASLFEVVRTKVSMLLYEDSRVCIGCGRTGTTRHTCPDCPCNFCKKEGHVADNCERLKRRKEKSSRPVGRFADGNAASGGPLSNPFSIAPRKNQLQLPPRRNADVTAGSGAVATSSAGGGGSCGPSSDSPGRYFSQRSSALDTGLSLKRKMEREFENARKKSTTTPTTLTPDVSPLLDAEVSYPERLESFRSG